MNERGDVPKVVRLLQSIDMGYKTIESIKNDASKFGLESNKVYNTIKHAGKSGYIDWKAWYYDKNLILTEKGIERLKCKHKVFSPSRYCPKGLYINHLLDIINSFKYPVSRKIIELHYLYTNFDSIFDSAIYRRYIKNVNGKYKLTNLGIDALETTTKRLNLMDEIQKLYEIVE